MKAGAQVGAYRVLRRLGEGGMGEVWLAEHAMLGRRAAIKVLRAEQSSRPVMVTRFFNEARAAASISDPGIVQIFDFGHRADGSAYIVMELLEGEGLDQRLRRRGVLAVPDALRIMRQVAGSLGAAHAAGIIHRDLKPENIFLVRDPEVHGGERAKILDFGIAKLVGERRSQIQTYSMLGTPTYMSPEQCRATGPVDPRSDVYSLGCVLYTLLTGAPPFIKGGTGEIIAAHLLDEAPRLARLVANIPIGVDQIVERCLAKDPAERFASGTELAAAIGAELGMPSEISDRTIPDAYVTLPLPIVTSSTTLSTASGIRPSTASLPSRSRGWTPLVALAGAAIGGAVAFVTLHGTGAASASSPPHVPAPHLVAPPPPVAAPDPKLAVVEPMKHALTSFVAWARDHAGAPCPDISVLATSADPWGHPFRITCADQPGAQIVGMISAGPDGVEDSSDDIASWQLGRDVTGIVKGPRWVVVPKQRVAALKRPAHRRPPPQPVPETPLTLDENGIPVAR